MSRFLALILFLSVVPQSLLAQWRVGPGSELYDGTVSAFGVTERGVGALALMCREGKPLLWTQGWALAKAGPDRQESFSVIVDGQSFPVSGLHLPEEGLWTGAPPDALIAALRAGSRAVVAVPGETQVGVSLRGSSRAITEVLDGCGGGVSPATGPSEAGGIVYFGQLIATQCGGGYSIADGAEMTGRLDGDETPDFVLDWGGVTCDDRSKGRGAGFCGAALCTIEIAFTETQSRQQVLGVNPELVDRAFGMKALKTTTQGATCGGAAQVCDVIWVWNGAKLEPVE
ncbi:hypothetical protein FIU97_19600 (plasmid) [Roseivivax sp. THAF40]|uniref:hypothetical protein n=1 Tax=unclassified Roseivivax TaxID=2639302 RepID=UPI0012691B0D|nr:MULTISPECIES: hypothetical protein [unclassified Roseivivax]QFS84900.1 hypothetical protein FIV09_18815 [Roseivivax sp. THAF197b]QFT48802.1 hypothetical protein FIU97_19600 [Roseivivax sp. THAF40]